MAGEVSDGAGERLAVPGHPDRDRRSVRARSSGGAAGADRDGCKRIATHGADVGIAKGRGLRVEVLDTMKAQALAANDDPPSSRRTTPSPPGRLAGTTGTPPLTFWTLGGEAASPASASPTVPGPASVR